MLVPGRRCDDTRDGRDEVAIPRALRKACLPPPDIPLPIRRILAAALLPCRALPAYASNLARRFICPHLAPVPWLGPRPRVISAGHSLVVSVVSIVGACEGTRLPPRVLERAQIMLKAKAAFCGARAF